MFKSALFVDFDNIYIGLEQGGGNAADRFARDPLQWVDWLERLAVNGAPQEGRARRLLVRRVYSNPQQFGRYRAYFIRSGFEVVDTPPLTAQGKTSADTHMVLDILDSLSHETRFDEFIVFSGDADFTPLLLRLRKHDRRTAVLAIGPSSAAYKAACDHLIDEDSFLEQALGQGLASDPSRPQPRPRPADQDRVPSGEVLERMGRRLVELTGLTGALEPWQLPQVYKEFAEFSAGSKWLGYFSLKAMTEAVVAAVADRLAIVGGDDWRIEPRAMTVEGETPPRSGEQAASHGVAPAVPPPAFPAGSDRLAEIAAFVRRHVDESAEPVVLATLAQRVIDEFGEAMLASRWLGAGSFKALLARLDLSDFAVSQAASGFLYDPSRHVAPVEEKRYDGFAEADPELAELARTVHELTDMPYLTPEMYAGVLQQIARELDANGFHLTSTSKAVRDRCHERGISVARSDVSFLLKGLSFSPYRLHDPGPHDPVDIGRAIARNTVLLCQRAQMELSAEDQRRIERWIVGGLEAPGAGAAAKDEPEEPVGLDGAYTPPAEFGAVGDAGERPS